MAGLMCPLHMVLEQVLRAEAGSRHIMLITALAVVGLVSAGRG